MGDTGNTRDEVAELIASALAPKSDLDSEWMWKLHSSYVTRHLADNDRTWSTANWLVALAWTLFPAAVAFDQRLSWYVVVAFGGTSIALVMLWFVIAMTHRAWASRSLDIVRAIESVALGEQVVEGEIRKREEVIRGKLNLAHKVPWILGTDPMKRARWVIVIGTIFACVVLFVAVAVFDFPPPPPPSSTVPAAT